MRCLVAGATGAIGRHLVRLLANDPSVKEVIVLSRRTFDPENDYPSIFNIDYPSPAASKLILMVENFLSDADWGEDLPRAKALQQNTDEAIDAAIAQDEDVGLPPPPDGRLVQLMKNVNVAFTAMGTSRANEEVKKTQQETSYARGFARWLRKVDFFQNLQLARAAKLAGVDRFVRVSATKASASVKGSEDNPWGWYVHFQGISDEKISSLPFSKGCVLLRPGRLDRGEELRALREWEVQGHAKNGPGLSVEVVAARGVREGLEGEIGPGGVLVVEQDDFVKEEL